MSGRPFAAAMLAILAAALAFAEDTPPEPAPGAAPAGPVIDAKAVRKLSVKVSALAASPDGRWVAAGDDEGSLVLFATESGERRPAGQAESRITHIVFTADSQWVIATPADDEGKQQLIAADVATGKVLRPIDVSVTIPKSGARASLDSFYQAVPVPGGARVELLRKDTIEVWDLSTGERVEVSPNKDPWVQWKRRSRDGTLLAIDGTGPIRVVDGATGARVFEVPSDEGGMKGNVLIGSHYTTVAGFATAAGVLVLHDTWDEVKDPKTLTDENLDQRTKYFRKLVGVSTRDGRQLWKRDVAEHVYADDVIVGAETAAVPDGTGKLAFINCANGQIRESAPVAKKWTSAAVSPDGLTFWGGAEDGSVVVLKSYPAPKAK